MRLDKYLADKFGSRTKAEQGIMSGIVLVNGKNAKPSDEISEFDEIKILDSLSFVSNGGYKLNQALNDFDYEVKNKTFADIGASTGGFTDCLIKNGAKKVYCVDVGESLLDKSLESDLRVVSITNCNARYLDRELLLKLINDTQKSAMDCLILDGMVVDVSFISLKHVLPVCEKLLNDDGVVFALIKPQFESENKNISKNGIVKKEYHKKIIEKVLNYAKDSNLFPLNIVNAPIKPKKNIEYVVLLQKNSKKYLTTSEITQKASNLI